MDIINPSVSPAPLAEIPLPTTPAIPPSGPAAVKPSPAGMRLARRLDTLLLCGCILFAFFVASFAVRNSDFWQHLAVGRMLSEGHLGCLFGEDPFAYTTAGTYWANHAWLFDLTVFGLYRLVGGSGLVVVKALLVTTLAVVMLRIRRPGSGARLPAVCTTLALLAMSPRLLLQPAIVSCLFLGLTLTLLWQPYAGPMRRNGLRLGLLLALFALWVNIDAWFLLGPLLVALFWLGERRAGQPRHTPGWLVLAALAMCLVSPQHWHTFTLPSEVSPAVWLSGLPQDPRFRMLFLSPWQLSDYLQPGVGLNAAGLAYFLLTAVGLISFALGQSGQRDWRVPVWVAFAALGAFQVRDIPFFAVIAGPITALNLQDWLAQSTATRPAPGLARFRWELIGRLGLLLAVLVLVGLTWPGWLHAVPHDTHQVAWAVHPEPGLQRFAEAMHQWRLDGRLARGERIFATHPDVAHYCAWFAPGEQSFLDHRFPLFISSAGKFEVVCRAVGAVPGKGGPTKETWQQVLRDRGVRVVIVYDGDEQRLFAALRRLDQNPTDWALLRVDGRALTFAWREDEGEGPRRPGFDPDRLVYGTDEAPEVLPPAPTRGLRRAPHRPAWWADFARPAPFRPWEADAAAVYLRYFEDQAEPQRQEARGNSLSGYAASLAGLPALAPGPWEVSSGLLVRMFEVRPFLPGIEDRRPELPLLTIRAARRAVAANPDDVGAWLRLGQAYLALHNQTGERHREGPWQLLEILRHIQAATALEHALILEPELEPAHRALATLYSERMYLDAALAHGREAVRLTGRGPQPGEGSVDLRLRLAQEQKRLEELEQVVRDRRNDFAIRSQSLSGNPLARAQLALDMGLPLVALDEILLRSPVQLFGGEGARLELELLLLFGRAEEARVKLEDEEMLASKRKLGDAAVPAPPLPGYFPAYQLPAYEWLRFCQAAALGDHETADRSLGEVLHRFEEEQRDQVRLMRAGLPLSLASEVGLATSPELYVPRLLVRSMHEQVNALLNDPALLPPGKVSTGTVSVGPSDAGFRARARADLHTLGGLLALEQGDPAGAAAAFRGAFAAAGRAPFAGQQLAGAYQRRLTAVRSTREEK
jgi:tetratricopeptide (TPR) repeat protein